LALQRRKRRNGNNDGNENNKNRYNLSRQIGRNMNLFNKVDSVTTNINVPVTIYTYNTTGVYSFTSGADTRFLAFNTICSTSSTADFGKYSAIFQDYRIEKASVLVSRVQNTISVVLTEALPSLYLNCDPEIINTSVTNPNNLNVLESDNSKFIPATILDAKVITFTFPGVGNGTHQWLPVNITTPGGFYIGNNPTATTMPSTNIIAFDCIFSLVCTFRGSISH